VDVPAGAPIDTAHGVDPAEPKTTLEVPPVELISRILAVWQANKKTADVVLVLDTSGSMNQDEKIQNAKLGAQQFLTMMGERDSLSFLPFSSDFNWAFEDLALGQDGKSKATAAVNSVFAAGETSLYDSIQAAYQHLKQRGAKGKIQAVVVLTDGEDTDSKTKLPALLDEVRCNGESNAIRIFTIAYGRDAKKDILQQIAEATQAKSYTGNPQTIVGVFRDVSTFF
jgi:Ca-activated chloride channel family protein